MKKNLHWGCISLFAIGSALLCSCQSTLQSEANSATTPAQIFHVYENIVQASQTPQFNTNLEYAKNTVEAYNVLTKKVSLFQPYQTETLQIGRASCRERVLR